MTNTAPDIDHIERLCAEAPQPPEVSTEFFGAHRYNSEVLNYQEALRAYVRDWRAWADSVTSQVPQLCTEVRRLREEAAAREARVAELEAGLREIALHDPDFFGQAAAHPVVREIHATAVALVGKPETP
jgi:hypothetical protein